MQAWVAQANWIVQLHGHMLVLVPGGYLSIMAVLLESQLFIFSDLIV